MIYDLDTDRDQVVSRLRQQALMKICTKILDELELLKIRDSVAGGDDGN